MKKIYFIALALLLTLPTAAGQNKNSDTEFEGDQYIPENFVKGAIKKVYFEKCFTDGFQIPSYIRPATILDMESGSLNGYFIFSTRIGTSTYQGIIDLEEVSDCIDVLTYIIKKELPVKPQNETEVFYSSKGGIKVGVYSKPSGTWKTFITYNNYVSSPSMIFNGDTLIDIFEALRDGKTLLDIELEKSKD